MTVYKDQVEVHDRLVDNDQIILLECENGNKKAFPD